MSALDTRSFIPKLEEDGRNWVNYKDHITMALESSGHDAHLSSNSAHKDYGGVGTINGTEPADRWRRGESYVKQVIAATIPQAVFNQIKGGTRTKDVWEALKKMYEERSRTTRVELVRRFRNKKCGEKESVRTHFQELSALREQLVALGKTIDDEDYTDTLLASLPSSYDHEIASINASSKMGSKQLTPGMVIELFTDEYERRTRNQTNKSNTQEEAFSADTNKKRDLECFNCKKRGHVRADCWAPGGGKEGQRPARRGKAKATDTAASATDTVDIEAWAAIIDWSDDDWPEEAQPKDEDTAWLEEVEEDQPEVVVAAGDTRTIEGVESELYDSGASRHMSPYRHKFVTYRDIEPRAIAAADKRLFYAQGMGDLRITVPNGELSTPMLLKDVLYAPDMGLSIVSISRIAKAGHTVVFEGETCKITNKGGKTIGIVPATPNGLYRVDHSETAGAATEAVTLLDLHRRLGHISADTIRTLIQRGTVTGLTLTDNTPILTCDSCEHAKTTRKPIRKERVAPQADKFGAEVHSDVWGPSPVQSLGGRKYYITFTDDHTRYTRINLLRTKDEALGAYKAFASWAETQHGVRIKRLRSDRGGEFTGNDFTVFLKEQGTERRLTTHDTPQHNGVAESLNRRLLERVRAILHHSGLPKTLWGEAIHFAVWLKNRTSTRVLGDTTPHERLHRAKPNLAGLPEWGQSVWVHDTSGSKLDARAKEGRWVGFDSESTHAHRIYWPGKNSVSVERDIKFAPTAVRITFPPLPEGEQSAHNAPASNQTHVSQQGEDSPSTTSDTTKVDPTSRPPMLSKLPTPSRPTTRSMTRAANASGSGRQTTNANTCAEVLGSPRGTQLQGEPHGESTSYFTPDDENSADFVFHATLDHEILAAVHEAEGDPKTLHEARSRSDWPCWKEAMDREMDTLEKALTWNTVPRPPGKNIVGSKWVFRIKRNADGSIDKYKARLVAKGFTQIHGVDYFDTFSPVAKLSSFRTILAYAARYDWEVESFDFNGAYLNGELNEDEEIYMQEPPGYETGSGSSYVKRLLKSLYGLKQAGRKWYDALRRILIDLGFRVSSADPGVFYARIDEHILILAVHVDDCAMTGSSAKLICLYKRKLNEQYALTDLGPIHWLLGIKISRNRAARTISLSQTAYIESIINRFNLTDAKSVTTPMIPGAVYSKQDTPSDPAEAAQMKAVPYREAIGSLMYASVATRPDITFAVSTLSQFLDNPGPAHWDAVKRIFRYLAGTKTLTLTYGGERHDLVGYTDADGASQEHRRAISGSAFLIDGGTISWSSRKQELVTLSTAEAEYVAATHAAKEGIWLRRFIGELFPPIPSPTTLHCDNQAACKMATTDNFHARTKHIDIRYHFIRQTIEDGTFDITYCPTDDMTADALTKALPGWKVKGFASALGLRCA
jgi:hypothetical protein